MGDSEVTQAQWKTLSGGTNPACFQSTTSNTCASTNAFDSRPVEQVDWYSSVAFANAKSAAAGLSACYALTGCTDPINGWKDGAHTGCAAATSVGPSCAGYRLPTESEWEYAARAGTTSATYLGNLSGKFVDCTTAQASLDGIAWWCLNTSGTVTRAVKTKVANGWGLYDMLGNVYEWTGDWYGSYPSAATDPTGAATGSYRAIRGGAWSEYSFNLRSSVRGFDAPDYRIVTVGFRLARTAP
jgi:formylglycine-generating enzyme required for sulfatase activity